MNGNRGQYTSSPLYNMKKQRPAQRPAAQPVQEAGGGAPQEGRRYQWLSIVMSVALPVLFLVSLFVPNNGLRWFFLIAAAASVACMWTLGAFVQSARGTLTVIYTALAVVVGLALFMNSQTDTASAPARNAPSGAVLSSQTGGGIPSLLATPDPNAAPEATDAPAETVSAAQLQLTSFFTAWQAKNIPEMLKYCAPSWVNAQTSPEEKLYQMLYSEVPEAQPEIERIEGSDGNTSRIVTLKVWFNGMSGRTHKRLPVVMVKVNDVWYVDPNSLGGGVVIDEAAEAAAAQNRTSLTNINYTLAPATATPNPSSITVYYNEQGGKYYHAAQTCAAVNEQYWPLTGFSFDLINSDMYKHLLPCTRCNPPAR